MENHQELLNQIGYSLDIELAFDDNRQCFLLLDEHLMVSIRSLDDGWILYGMLGDMDTNEREEGIARTLLALNLQLAQSGSASIAIDASSDVIMLVQRIDTAAIDARRMEEILGRFIDTLSNAITVLNGKQELDDGPTFGPAFSEAGFFHRR